MRGTFIKLWAISWTTGIALHLLITVDGWRGTLKYSKWGRFGYGGRRSAVQKFRKYSWSNDIHWKWSFYTVCARIVFSFLRSYIKKRRPKFILKSGEFFETYRLSFSSAFSENDSSTELILPDSTEWVFWCTEFRFEYFNHTVAFRW